MGLSFQHLEKRLFFLNKRIEKLKIVKQEFVLGNCKKGVRMLL